jgi:hypothetical protein
MDWKTDADLFLASLDVCPNSAKLNLQVTKLYINRGDYADAERHIAAAKAIDPEFCDIWYQVSFIYFLNAFVVKSVELSEGLFVGFCFVWYIAGGFDECTLLS